MGVVAPGGEKIGLTPDGSGAVHKINIGVPQGSILGLLFFLIYINDLLSVISYTVPNKNSSIVLFADDTSVIISEQCLMNFERKLNIVFQIMKEWFNSNFFH